MLRCISPLAYSRANTFHFIPFIYAWSLDTKRIMRVKLIIIVSLLSSLLGAGLAVLVAWTLALAPVAILAPVATTVTACVFVYRHTARRRTLQAMLTALLTTTFVLLIIYAVHHYLQNSVK